MENLDNTQKSFDINQLTPEEADKLSAEIGAKVRMICDTACEEANKILNIYGMKAQMQIVVLEINASVEKTEEKPKKKRGRPRKDSQSLS